MTAFTRILRLVLFLVAALSSVFLFESCCMTGLHFSGKVVTKGGDAIDKALVQAGKRHVQTDANGDFRICVDRADRYLINVSKLNFGYVSKHFTDTTSDVVIMMSKSTVATVDPNQDIVVEDLNPDITVPAGASTTPVSPLDTIPFVFNSQGHLIGFTAPPEIKAAQAGIRRFQSPRRGAMIAIPAQSLVIEGNEKKARRGAMTAIPAQSLVMEDNEKKAPRGPVQVSVNTIDLYSPDGMPGDNTVDLGQGERGAMISYGAANIEAYSDGRALQLAKGKTATLTIPVDTLSILSKTDIPEEIPFLVYNRETGMWERDGTARLNEDRTAYIKQVSHFSTFNMDMVWAGQSCIQLCDGISTAAAGTTNALDITVPGKTKRMIIPGAVPCGAGTTDCAAYGIDGPGTHAIINLQNNIPVQVQVYKNASTSGSGGTLEGTYIFNSGPAPSGSPSTYQACLYNDCAGPFRISDAAACYEKTTPTRDGSMLFPVMTFSPGVDVVNFSWIFIESFTGGTVTNTPAFYEIEYQTYSSGDAFDPVKPWVKVDFNPGLPQTETFPPLTDPATTDWHITTSVDFSGSTGATNPQLTATDRILFRVNHSTTGVPGSFTKGVVRAINMPPAADAFTISFNATYPCNISN